MAQGDLGHVDVSKLVQYRMLQILDVLWLVLHHTIHTVSSGFYSLKCFHNWTYIDWLCCCHNIFVVQEDPGDIGTEISKLVPYKVFQAFYMMWLVLYHPPHTISSCCYRLRFRQIWAYILSDYVVSRSICGPKKPRTRDILTDLNWSYTKCHTHTWYAMINPTPPSTHCFHWFL